LYPSYRIGNIDRVQVGVVAVGNSIQNLVTLHYTRRIYSGLFVRNPTVSRAPKTTNFDPEDSIDKLTQASSTGKDVEKAQDQVTPLTARVFGMWTALAGIIRIFAAYDITNPPLYQMSFLTHVMAALHFTSEIFVYKTVMLRWEVAFPVVAGWSGAIYMALQYQNYIG